MRLLALVLTLSGCAPDRNEPDFIGLERSPQGERFILSIGNRRSSPALSPGDLFEGYRIVAFDPQKNILTVEKDGQRQHLPLKGVVTTAPDAKSLVSLKHPIVIVAAGQPPIPIPKGQTDLSSVEQELNRIGALDPQPKVDIFGDEKADHATLMKIMPLVSAAGLKKVNVVTVYQSRD